jgi:MFS family permease
MTASLAPRRIFAGSPAVWSLAIAETIVWSAFYYLFPALLPRWEQDFGWAKTDITLALTLSMILAALVSPGAGALIDRDHGRKLLVGAALIGSLLVGALVFVATPLQFYALWLMIGLLMGASLYDPCFSFITRSYGTGARQAITLVTLVAGFAGTVSFSLSNLLAEPFGWRVAALAFSGLLLFVAAPLFWYGTKEPDRGTAQARSRRDPDEARRQRAALAAALRNPVFYSLAGAFALVYLNHGMLITHLLPLLDERGVALEVAVFSISMIGPLQVAGRIAMLLAERRLSTMTLCIIGFGGLGFASIALLASHLNLAFLGLFVLLQGSSVGVMSILRPVVTADLLGREGFGRIYGSLAMAVTACFAVAPWLGAVIWTLGGYDLLLVTTTLIGFCALGLLLLATWQQRRRPQP